MMVLIGGNSTAAAEKTATTKRFLCESEPGQKENENDVVAAVAC
jgi:hypothetical protein